MVSPSIYALKSGQYQVSYLNPYDMKRKRHKFSSKKKARDYAVRLGQRYLDGTLRSPTDRKVGELMDQYLSDFPNTRIKKRKRVYNEFIENHAHFKLSQLDYKRMNVWMNQLKEKYDYSDRTMNSIKSLLNGFFKYLIDEKLIQESPLNKVKFKRKPKVRRARVVLSCEEVHEILNNAKMFSPTVLYPFLACVAHTGARRAEVANLERGDINFQAGQISFKRTKNGHQRFVNIAPALQGILADHLERHSKNWVFVRGDGQKIDSKSNLTRIINQFKAHFPVEQNNWSLHALRHSFAYNFLKKGGNMYQLQAMLGHRSIDVTVDIYGQLQAADVKNPSPFSDDFEVAHV